MSLLWAIWPRSPRAIRTYVAVQLGTFIGLAIVVEGYGRESDVFRFAYCLATLAIVSASWEVVFYAGADFWIAAFSCFYGLFLLLWAIVLLPHAPTIDTVILLAAAPCVFSAGFALMMRARFSRYDKALAILAADWLALGGSLFGFAIEAHKWDAISYWLTYVLGIVAFGVLGVELRHGEIRRRDQSTPVG